VTGAVLDRPDYSPARRPLDGGATLEELLTSALAQARVDGRTDCPVCHARMSSTRAGAREAECGGCGSRLS
jgi:hypothetical protein